MEELWRYFLIKILLVCVLVVRLEAVTVNPAPCPTNKIAPHKRTARWDQSRPRTFGSFYNLLAPTGVPGNDLVEKPQDDALDDCGDIEDYDENDLSSVTPQSQRRQGSRNNRFFGGLGFLFPFHGPRTTTKKPPVTFRPVRPSYPPTRPPYASGGVFSGNVYKPPSATDPSVHVKPVHDGIEESQITYRPGLVGAPSGLVIGAPQISPTRYSLAEPVPETTVQNRGTRYVNSARFPPQTTQASSSSSTSKRSRNKKQKEDDSIIARDLLRAIKVFFRRHKQFRKTPTYFLAKVMEANYVPDWVTICIRNNQLGSHVEIAGRDQLKDAKRIVIRRNQNGFYITVRQLSYWSALGARYWVPVDKPEEMSQILDYIMP